MSTRRHPETERGAVISHSLIARRRRKHRRPGGAAGPRPQSWPPSSCHPRPRRTHRPGPQGAGPSSCCGNSPSRRWAQRFPSDSPRLGTDEVIEGRSRDRGQDDTGGSSSGSSPREPALLPPCGEDKRASGTGRRCFPDAPRQEPSGRRTRVTRHRVRRRDITWDGKHWWQVEPSRRQRPHPRESPLHQPGTRRAPARAAPRMSRF